MRDWSGDKRPALAAAGTERLRGAAIAPSEGEAAVGEHIAMLAAEQRALALLRAIEERQIVRAGETEESVRRAIVELAASKFGATKHWHRLVVRSGPHTRMRFAELAPDRTIEDDDIVFIDLGVVIGELEADVGRTLVLGNDPEKQRLVRDLPCLFRECEELYVATPGITGRELFAQVERAAARRGWAFGGSHAGHLVGRFPFSREMRDRATNRIRPDNESEMHANGPNGEPRHWILELLLLDPTGRFGGFFEQLLAPDRTGVGPVG